MKYEARKLSNEEIGLLEDHFHPVNFSNAFELVYENQVPNFGIVLLEGEVLIIRKKKVRETIGPGTILGIQELINNRPVKFGCRIGDNAKVILLQKSEILEVMQGRDNLLKKALIP